MNVRVKEGMAQPPTVKDIPKVDLGEYTYIFIYKKKKKLSIVQYIYSMKKKKGT